MPKSALIPPGWLADVGGSTGLATGCLGTASGRLGVATWGRLMLEEGAVVAGRWAQTVSGCPMRPPATRNKRNVLVNFISENAAHEGPGGKLCYKYFSPSCRLGEQDSAAAHISEGGTAITPSMPIGHT